MCINSYIKPQKLYLYTSLQILYINIPPPPNGFILFFAINNLCDALKSIKTKWGAYVLNKYQKTGQNGTYNKGQIKCYIT